MDFTETTVASHEIYSGRIIKVKEDIVKLPDGKQAGRELVLHNGGVGVIAIDKDKNVLMVNQYRKPYESVLLEIPAGKLEGAEDPYEAGIRELREETGYTANIYEYLGKCYPSPGFLNEIVHLYLAEELEFVGQDLDAGEFVEVKKIQLEKLVQMVMNDEIKDAKTQIAILKAYNLKR